MTSNDPTQPSHPATSLPTPVASGPDNAAEEIVKLPPDATIPGKWIVLGLFGFGICASAFLWLYTYFSNKPYIPLRHAIVQTYGRPSSPVVQGGRERGRGPVTLRIIMNVDFDASLKDAETVKQVREMERQIADLARKHLELSAYERWQFVLIHYRPEMLPTRFESLRDIHEVIDNKL